MEELLHFFDGRKSRDSYSSDFEDAVETSLPESFWTLPTRVAVNQYVDRNQNLGSRGELPENAETLLVPEDGWLVFEWNSSACYSSRAHTFSIRFGVERCWALVSQYSSIGVVGYNPYVDRPGYQFRVIELSPDEAEQLVEMVTMLTQFKQPTEDYARSSNGFSTADGSGILTLWDEQGVRRELAAGTVKASGSVSSWWTGPYDEDVALSLIDHLLSVAWPEHLGDRWGKQPKPSNSYHGIPLEKRLAERLVGEARLELALQIKAALARHETDSLPPMPLKELVSVIGDEALVGFRDPIEALLSSLEPPTDDEVAYRAYQERNRRDHFGLPLSPLGDDPFGPKKEPKDEAESRAWALEYEKRQKEESRMLALGEVLNGQADFVLRDTVMHAAKQLRVVTDSDMLGLALDRDDVNRSWGMNQLRMLDPRRWSQRIVEEFHGTSMEAKTMLFNALAAGHPQSAAEFAAKLDPTDFDLVKLDVVAMEIRDFPSSANKRLPMLFRLLENRTSNAHERGRVMGFLGAMKLTQNDEDRFKQILVEDIKQLGRTKSMPSFSSEPQATDCLDEAINALSRLPEPEKHAGVVAETIFPSWSTFDAAVEYLAHCEALTTSERTRHLETLVRPRFDHHGGMMNDVFTAALVFDLKKLEPEVTQMATLSPEDREDPGADHASSQFQGPKGKVYHRAREVLALWHAPDEDTRVRMWIAFVLNHPYEFMLQSPDDFAVSSLRRKAKSVLSTAPDSKRVAWTKEALEHRPLGKWYLKVQDWLYHLE